MTQPEEAVGGANDAPVVAAEPTIEDRLTAAIDAPQDDPDKKPEDPPEAGEEEAPVAEAELTEEDVAEAEAAEPPIKPPVSWTAEEQEEFAKLPRELQETVTRREADREKFVQSKAQEAKQAQAAAEKQAVEQLNGRLQAHATALESLLVAVPQKPSYQLQADDPDAFAYHMDAHERAAAHNQWVEQQIANATHEAGRAAQVLQQHVLQETEAVLRDQFPEYLDATTGPELKQRLGSTARELGYTDDQLANVDGWDILAMRKANEWREDAMKYRALMAKKMEKVREAKNLPRVSRPGTSTGPGAVANQRYQADREAMKGGDLDAAARAVARFL